MDKDLTPEEEERIRSLISGIDASKKRALPPAGENTNPSTQEESLSTKPPASEPFPTEPPAPEPFPVDLPAPEPFPTEPPASEPFPTDLPAPGSEQAVPEPQPFPSEPQSSEPQPFPSEPQSSEPQPFPSEPQSSEPQPFPTEPQPFPTEPPDSEPFPTDLPAPSPESVVSESQPFPSEPQSSEPPDSEPFPTDLPAPSPESVVSESQPFSSEPQPFPTEPQSFESQPFPSEPQPFPTEPQSFEPQPFPSEPQPFPSEPQPGSISDGSTSPLPSQGLGSLDNQFVEEPATNQPNSTPTGNEPSRSLGDDLRPNDDNMSMPPFPGPQSGSQSPETADLSSSDYQPAYEMPAFQPSLGEEAVTVEIGDLPPAEDLIFMIAQVDPEMEKSVSDGQVLNKIRSESGGISTKKGRNRPKLNPLPFDMLTKGTPLVATVYSPSGGVGKSSTAMNLAAYIAAVGQTMANKNKKDTGARPPRVLVLDGDIVQGSLALRLTGELKPSIHTLQLYIDERNEQGFTREQAWPKYYSQEGSPPLGPGEKTMLDFVHWHKSLPNLNLLAAPERPDLFWDFGSEEYRFILRMLAKFYDVIIIDTGTDLVLDSQRSWLAHANEVFLVTAPENDRLYNASKAVDYMIHEQPNPQDNSENPRLEPPLVAPDKLSVVMTRYDMESGLDSVKIIDEIFPWLDSGQKFFVPDFSKEIIISNNLGEFLSLNNAKYAQSIDQLAQKIFQRYLAAKGQRGIPSST